MILNELEQKIAKRNNEGFVLPKYDGYSLVNIPNTAMFLLGIKPLGPVLSKLITKRINTKGVKKIAIILIDGLGYDMFLRACKYTSFFNELANKGVVAPLTSGFPSTTAASITTMNTGLSPQEHGVIEWTLYLKEIGMTINTLPFTSLDGTPLKLHNPNVLYNGKGIQNRFKSKKIQSYTIIEKQLGKAPYNRIFKSNKIETHVTNSDFAIRLREVLEKEPNKAYVYSYLSSVDAIAHEYGPHSEELEAEIRSISHAIEDGLIKKVNKTTAEETLIIVTADHGHTLLNPRDTIYLNTYTKLNRYYARDKKGKIIPPTGSVRDVFLHIRKDKLGKAEEFLSEKLRTTARVIRTKKAIDDGLFGYGEPSKKFMDRVGNLLILPYANKSVWYRHIGTKEFNMLGMHGGLSKEEMLIPFAAVKLSDLI